MKRTRRGLPAPARSASLSRSAPERVERRELPLAAVAASSQAAVAAGEPAFSAGQKPGASLRRSKPVFPPREAAVRRLRGEVRPGGGGLGGDGTGLMELRKILPLSVFRSAQRFGKEDCGAGDPRRPHTASHGGSRGFCAVIQAGGMSAHDLRGPRVLDCAPRGHGAFLKDAQFFSDDDEADACGRLAKIRQAAVDVRGRRRDVPATRPR